MFCPQCRLSWPNAGKSAEVKVDKVKRKLSSSSEWGSPLICPNCLVPLAADRIQGEFPSVAHASSTKEGSMTVKDVLRETAGSNSNSGEVALDDKKDTPSPRFLSGRKRAVEMLVGASLTGGRRIFHRMAVVAVCACVFSAIGLSIRAALTPKPHHQQIAALPSKPAPAPSLTSNQQALIGLMPAHVGQWTRNEKDSNLWADRESGTSIAQTYASTYRLGSERIQLWAVRAPTVQNASPLLNFYGAARVIHTDNGVVYVTPQVFDYDNTQFASFDYNSSPNDEFWIQTNQTFAPQKSHTISWYQSPYLLTIAADTVAERDSFKEAYTPTVK